MTGLNISQLKNLVIKPSLEFIGLYSDAACNLVTGTALVESGASYLHQVGTGPACGLWEVEPGTEKDCWDNYLRYNAELSTKVRQLMGQGPEIPNAQLIGNLFYGAAICRIKYARSLHPLPAANDAAGLANYHKSIYNTALGAANAEKNIPLFLQAIRA